MLPRIWSQAPSHVVIIFRGEGFFLTQLLRMFSFLAFSSCMITPEVTSPTGLSSKHQQNIWKGHTSLSFSSLGSPQTEAPWKQRPGRMQDASGITEPQLSSPSTQDQVTHTFSHASLGDGGLAGKALNDSASKRILLPKRRSYSQYLHRTNRKSDVLG